MDQNVTCYGGIYASAQTTLYKMGTQPPPTKRGTAPSLFGPYLLSPNGRPSQQLLPPYQAHLDPCSRLAAIDTGPKLGGSSCFLGRWAGSPSNTKSPEAYPHTKWHLDASSRMATIEMGRKLGRGLRPLFGEGLGPHLTQSRLGRGLPPHQVSS